MLKQQPKPRLARPLDHRAWPFFSKRAIRRMFAVTKSSKAAPRPFPKRAHVDTYAPRPTGICCGLPSQEASGRKRRLRALTVPFRQSVLGEGAQRFIAGWSSPVARQAHNLKVASSNLAPATKFSLHFARVSAALSEILSRAASWSPVPNDPSGVEFEAIGLTLPTSPQRSD